MDTGCNWALGANLRISCQWKRDKASAMQLWTPETCWETKEKLKRTAEVRRWQSRHQHWNLGCSRVEDINHCLVVSTKKNMAPGEVRTQKWAAMMTGNNSYRLYRVRGLRRNPWATEPLPIEEGTKAQRSWHIRCDFEVRRGRCAGKPKTKNRHHAKRTRTEATTEDPDEIQNLGRSGCPICENTGADWLFDAGRYDLGAQPWQDDVNGQWGTPVRAWYTSVNCARTEAASVKLRAYPRGDMPPGPLRVVDGPMHLSGWSGRPSERQTAMEVAKFSAHWLESGGRAVII